MDFPSPTEIEKQRNAWWASHAKPRMTMDEVIRLSEELFALYPKTKEERDQKTRDLQNMPEFVL